MDFLFGFYGRINRGAWWLGQIAIIALWFAYFMVIGFVVAPGMSRPASAHDVMSNGSGAVVAITLATLTLSVWMNFATSIKRFHDRDKSGWWMLISFVPIIGSFWLVIELGFLPGTSGGNGYGPGRSVGYDELAGYKVPDAYRRESSRRHAIISAPAPLAERSPEPVAPRRIVTPAAFGKRGR